MRLDHNRKTVNTFKICHKTKPNANIMSNFCNMVHNS